MSEPLLEVTDVHKAYGPGVTALRGVSLTLHRSEILCLLGPSGCGKTTLLRIVAGLETPDSGRLLFEGRDLVQIPVHKRGFGLMFQEFALFPDKNVAQNIAFGLRMAGWPQPAIRQRVDEMLALVNLEGYGERSIFALSGGERQRVALARSLAPSPTLLMLDEPLGSLDRGLRESLLDELHALLKRLGMTTLYVTHDQQEALAIADTVVVMNEGQIAQQGPPQAIHRRPANPFVARFLGYTNLLPAVLELDDGSPARVRTALGVQPAPPHAPAVAMDAAPATLLIRPSALRWGEAAQRLVAAGAPALAGRVRELSYRGATLRAEIEPIAADAPLLTFDVPLDAPLAAGAPLDFTIDPADCLLLPA